MNQIIQTTNSDNGDIKRSITWQYDDAEHLVALILMINDFFAQSTEQFWDDWFSNIENIDTATDFGLAIWGILLSLPRPDVQVGGTTGTISTNLYRKLLKLRLRLLFSNSSMGEYVKIYNEIFDGKIKVVDNQTMSMDFVDDESLDDETKAVMEQSPEAIFLYPTGVKHNVPCNDPVFAFAYDNPLDAEESDPEIAPFDASSFDWRNEQEILT